MLVVQLDSEDEMGPYSDPHPSTHDNATSQRELHVFPLEDRRFDPTLLTVLGIALEVIFEMSILNPRYTRKTH